MVVFSLGLPSRFGDWCNAVTARLAKRALGEVVEVVPTIGSTAEELALALIKTQCSHFLVYRQQPDHWLVQVLAETGNRFLLALDDPRVTVANLVAMQKIDFLEAIRAVASSCASFMLCLGLPGGLVLHADAHSRDLCATAAAIADHLRLNIDPADVDQAVADVAATGLATELAQHSSLLDSIAEPASEVVDGALGPYVEGLRGGALGQIVWDRELFFDERHHPGSNVIEITGRSRYLIVGPYIKLPPGGWTAEVVLGFSPEATDMNFIVDVFAGSQLGTASINPLKGGIFQVTLNFVVEPSNDKLLEIRVMNERAAFDGRLALAQARLSSQTIHGSVLDDNVTRELGLAS
jgi:hypothetical protein